MILLFIKELAFEHIYIFICIAFLYENNS